MEHVPASLVREAFLRNPSVPAHCSEGASPLQEMYVPAPLVRDSSRRYNVSHVSSDEEHARHLFHGFKCRVHWGDITDPKFCDEILSDLIKALNKMEASEKKEYLENEIQTLLGILRDEGFPFLRRCIELEFNSTLHVSLEDIIAQRMALDAISPKEMMLRYRQISE